MRVTVPAILLMLLISPVGAPFVAWAIGAACNIPWEGEYSCAVPKPLLDYFLPFAILPPIWVGTFLAVVWYIVALAIPCALIWLLTSRLWRAIMSRV
jgi:hypothetical protein